MDANMSAYVQNPYAILIVSPVIKRHLLASPLPDVAPLQAARRTRTASQVEEESFAYLETVHFVAGGEVIMQVPLLFLYGLQARRGGVPASDQEGPALPCTSCTSAVVYMQTRGGHDPEGALFCVDPEKLKKAPANTENHTKELRQLLRDSKQIIVTKNEVGEVHGTAVNIPVAHGGLMGLDLPWLKKTEDCVCCRDMPRHDPTPLI